MSAPPEGVGVRPEPDRCGAEWWAVQRAQWLGREVPETPGSDDWMVHYRSEGNKSQSEDGSPRGKRQQLAEMERMNLRSVLSSVESPYPALRKALPLPLVVRCAAELWSDEGSDPSPVARMAEAARAGSQDLMEKTAALGSSLAKWGQGLISNSTPRALGFLNPVNNSESERSHAVGGNGRSRGCGQLNLCYSGREPCEPRPGATLAASLRSRQGLGQPVEQPTPSGLSRKSASAMAPSSATATIGFQQPLTPASEQQPVTEEPMESPDDASAGHAPASPAAEE